MNRKRQEIRKKLKNQQEEIINYVLRFRYLNRIQIQQLLNQKSKTNILQWVNELTENHYLFSFYKKEIGSKPSTYCLDTASIPYLRKNRIEERIIKRIYSEKTLTQKFRDLKIFIATVYLSLLDLMKKTKGALSFQTKDELYGIQYLIFPNPNAYFSIKDVRGDIKRYFLDIFDDEVFIKKRIYQHLTYFKRRYWQHHTNKPFPEVILIFPNVRSKENAYRFIQKKLNNAPSFYVTTKDQVVTKGLHKGVLEHVV